MKIKHMVKNAMCSFSAACVVVGITLVSSSALPVFAEEPPGKTGGIVNPIKESESGEEEVIISDDTAFDSTYADESNEPDTLKEETDFTEKGNELFQGDGSESLTEEKPVDGVVNATTNASDTEEKEITDEGYKSSGVSATISEKRNASSQEETKTGWIYENGSYSYYKNGNRYTGWHYMTAAEGEKTPHWSYFGKSGTLVTGWKHFTGADGEKTAHWSYFGDNGWLRTGWVRLGKGTSNPDGNAAPHWSYFGNNGWLRTEWVRFGKGTSEPDGNSAIHWSYFGGNGWLRTGWQDMGAGTSNPDGNSAKHRSYFGGNGWLRTGLQQIDGNTYTFDSKGWLIYQDQEMLNKAQGYSSSTGYLILVNRAKCKTAIFTGKYGNWQYNKYWSCCVGAPSTPTITGIFRLGYKARYFDTGDVGRCWYKSQISGSYLFHSVIYYRDSGPYSIYDGTMGKWVSHGCVRLDIQNAKYIYDTVPSGTTIVIYN